MPARPLLIPVIDLKGGLVVRGVGGRRHEYRPLQSRLTDAADPVAVAHALADCFRPTCLYLADLDAIAGNAPAWVVYRDIRLPGVALWVDAGIRAVDEALALADAGVEGVVCGLETLPGPEVLEAILHELGPERVIFSLDLKDGRLLSEKGWERFAAVEPYQLAAEVIAIGVRRLIVLDLARVGEGQGTGTEALCRQITSAFRDVRVYAGGGVHGPVDVQRLADAGIAGVLVASALHDGRITPG